MLYYRVNEQGKIVEVLSEYEENEFVVKGWEGSFCEPVYNFEKKQWVEGLPPEEVELRKNEQPPKTDADELREHLATMQGAIDFIIMNY